ncbi:MAG: hypothetical protein COU85_02035 [Candidatus Portnoybacteria bacterium CG10_big_fil_rev_8_21_14_0_10_44_7]|uniref:Transcriptional repressor n=1 Tax=Candidatus Portnoybacteria bacterium CG10_big_fil_rev_8_21_14_0_10_44_7 TaxID=1974816 RepID=A0A2M8KIK6_9BACT|nr:MAG: hypothetical protein COU85_02035 [Candidatus Portnoybacteria bacterium CG10_big_fil_rev_8_21_14_0_10_44_7]
MREKIRKIILEFLKNGKTHSASSDIFNYLKEKLGDCDFKVCEEELIKLVEENKITSSFSVNKERRYEAETRYHYHFICGECGKVKDVFLGDGAVQMIKDHAQQIVNSYAKIEKTNLSFQGVCHECRRK